MSLSDNDIAAIVLTLQVAFTTTLLLLVIGTPIAWWLAQTQSRLRGLVHALVALPLVLPPSVLGFYLLLAMGVNGPLGSLTSAMGIGTLAFTFSGVVVASVCYSLPFVVQPIYTAFSALGSRPFEVAATLGANRWDSFFSVALPQAKRGFIGASILGFAHTVGEFGVVLMVGGNIPGVTRVVSVQVYDHVEALEYTQAHSLSAILLVFSFVVLALVYGLGGRKKQNLSPMGL